MSIILSKSSNSNIYVFFFLIIHYLSINNSAFMQSNISTHTLIEIFSIKYYYINFFKIKFNMDYIDIGYGF